MLLSCVIYDKENRDVVTCIIPGALMHVNIYYTICVQLTGPLTMLIAQVDPNIYEKYIIYENIIPVIYMVLEEAIYGTLQADLFFCKDLTSILQDLVLN